MAQKRSASIDATVREPLKLAIELQRMGGDSFMNLARGHGVSYRQIAEEVAQRLGIKFDQPLENMALAELETQVAEKLIEQYKDKLSRADRQVFDAELKAAAQKEQRAAQSLRCRPIRYGCAERHRAGGVDRVYPARGAATAIPVVGQALAAAMLLVTGVRAFSGPAYSIATLAVLVVGLIRQRMEREAQNQEIDLVVQVAQAFDLPRDTVMRTVASD
jgi:uncharacterized protein YaaW (UPF0174 family)